MKSAVWISFDLGLRGDYEGMYTWLDQHEAKECGDNFALLRYEHEGELIENLKKDIRDSVEINKKTRIYLIFISSTTKKPKGKFIFGNRKAAPWSGYAGDNGETDEDEI